MQKVSTDGRFRLRTVPYHDKLPLVPPFAMNFIPSVHSATLSVSVSSSTSHLKTCFSLGISRTWSASERFMQLKAL